MASRLSVSVAAGLEQQRDEPSEARLSAIVFPRSSASLQRTESPVPTSSRACLVVVPERLWRRRRHHLPLRRPFLGAPPYYLRHTGGKGDAQYRDRSDPNPLLPV